MSCGRLGLAFVGVCASSIAAACANGNDAAAPATTATTTVTTTLATTVTVAEAVTDATASASTASEPEGSGTRELKVRGNGDRRLPPFRVMRGGTTLLWTNTGEVFSLFSEEGTLVDSVATEGETFLQGGIHRIDVVASGSWVIRVPRARRIG